MKGMQLEWDGHDKAMSTKLWEFFNEDYLVDFSVTCHGQQMKVHKFVLALMFPILKESLRSSGTFPLDHEEIGALGESTMPLPQGLNLDNIADHAEDMDYLIQFAYTGKTTVPKEHADCLMRIADNMEIKSLKDSLDQWKYKSTEHHDRVVGKRKETSLLTSSRLRPRLQLKKLVDSTMLDSDNDVETDSVIISRKQQCNSRSRPSVLLSKKVHRFMSRSNRTAKEGLQRETTEKKDPTSNNAKKRPVIVVEDSSHSGGLQEIADKNEDCANINETKETDKDQDRSESNLDGDNDNLISLQEKTTTSVGYVEEVLGDTSLKCPNCDYVAAKPYFLKRHLQCHSNKRARRYTCKACKKVFGTRNMFRIHSDSKCGKELPHECKYCGHKTLRKVVLLQHMAAKHMVDGAGNPLEKNLQCSQCNFVCFAKHQLRRHSLAKHELVNKYKCTECTYTAPFRNDLLKHVRIIHQRRRDYMCEECGFQSQTSSGLSRHVMIIHKGIKPHKCEVCGAEYSDTLSFKLHRQRHTGGAARNHVCHVCGQGFYRRDHLRVHCRCKHKVELASAKPNYDFPKNNSNELQVAKTIDADDAAIEDSLNYLMDS